MAGALTTIDLDIEPSYRGKVRDIYDLGNELLVVASDRLSAFDVVFKQGIPGKGAILNRIAAHWFSLLQSRPHHLISIDSGDLPEQFKTAAHQLKDRFMLVKKTRRIDFECVVRGFLLGSGYQEYKETGAIKSQKLPRGLKFADKLPEPVFTPATKADSGHDENVSFEYMQNQLGSELAGNLKKASLELYSAAAERMQQQGIILADTKIEFGLLDSQLVVIDEVFTPDSSRFFDIEGYQKSKAAGEAPVSLDKQIIRDYLEHSNWDKQPPAPDIPDDVIEHSLEQYKLIERRIQCITSPM